MSRLAIGSTPIIPLHEKIPRAPSFQIPGLELAIEQKRVSEVIH